MLRVHKTVYRLH